MGIAASRHESSYAGARQAPSRSNTKPASRLSCDGTHLMFTQRHELPMAIAQLRTRQEFQSQHLRSLSCWIGPVPDKAQVANELAFLLRHCPQLVSVKIVGFNFSEVDLTVHTAATGTVLEAIDESCSNLKRLVLTCGGQLDSQAGKSLASVSSRGLERLNVSGCDLSNPSALLAWSQGESSSLRLLDLSRCGIHDEGFKLVLNGLSGAVALDVLVLVGNELSARSLSGIGELLQAHQALKTLHLDQQALFRFEETEPPERGDRLDPFLKAVETHAHLRELSVVACAMDAKSLSSLLVSLTQNSALRCLRATATDTRSYRQAPPTLVTDSFALSERVLGATKRVFDHPIISLLVPRPTASP